MNKKEIEQRWSNESTGMTPIEFTISELERQKKYYEKELEMADIKWKSNEKYRERYMDGYVEEKLDFKQNLIERIENKEYDRQEVKRLGIIRLDDLINLIENL